MIDHNKINAADSYQLIHCSDTTIVLVDPELGAMSLTNNAINVIDHLSKSLPGGIGSRKVYYRDSMGRFDELVIRDERFSSFYPCTPSQQAFLTSILVQRD
ncbi:hypothetical protein [Endozoicomonas sp. ALC066]|uniref:hypothetical protein n=1 Tax=Endozoicomonas sp. ALC066 TaxID=3403078 RepID=UPI003BB4DC58